ncbi:MAG: hypothetical protein J6S85_19535 [Methanobrevibacter sp.]|nr:hypothetical protein [Methanobrevibacter sp.]
METLNARIVGSKLGFNEHGIFDFCLVLEIQNGGGVSLGGYAMDQYNEELKKRVGTEYGMNLIMRILEVVGVNTWEELCGKYIRIKDAKIGDRVTAIGNLMKDEWVDFDTFGKEEE